MDWDKYTNRLHIEGITARERSINRLKNTITQKAFENPSYKSVSINGIEAHLIINSGTQPYYKEFKTLPNESINIGDYVDFANRKWLVTTADSDNEVYIDGKLEECNYLLKWQNTTGDIIERHAIIKSASKYNDGENGNNVIVLGSDQLSVAVPIDNESINIRRKTKFFIDNSTTNPTVYELTGTNNVADSYNGHGVTSWIVKECAYKIQDGDLEHGVCNYFTPSSTTTDPDDGWYMRITCANTTIKPNGVDKIITAQLYNSDGTPIEDNVTYTWTVTSDISQYITNASNENQMTISLSESCEDIGEEIMVTCASATTGQTDSIVLTVRGVY